MIKSWDYKKEYNLLKKKIIFSIDKSLRSGKLFFGNEVLKFEKEFLKKINQDMDCQSLVEQMQFIFL